MCRSSISLPLSLEKNHLSLSQIVYTNFRNCRCSIVWLTLLLFKSSKPSSFSNFFITLSLASNYLAFWSYRIEENYCGCGESVSISPVACPRRCVTGSQRFFFSFYFFFPLHFVFQSLSQDPISRKSKTIVVKKEKLRPPGLDPSFPPICGFATFWSSLDRCNPSEGSC